MKWEYQKLTYRSDQFERAGWRSSTGLYDASWDDLIEALNDLGQSGWEMCGKHKGVIILKRPIDPQPQIVNNITYTTAIRPEPSPLDLMKVFC